MVSGGRSGLFFDLRYVFAIAQPAASHEEKPWSIVTESYEYRLLDHDHRELLAFHWQPGSHQLGPDFPHLHISASLDAKTDAVRRRQIKLDKLHIVTGPVSVVSVVRMLIDEFDAAPRRRNWKTILGEGDSWLSQHARSS
jgi:hypothetical protein